AEGLRRCARSAGVYALGALEVLDHPQVVLDIWIGRAQRQRGADELLRLGEVTAPELDRAKHMERIMRIGGVQEHLRVICRGIAQSYGALLLEGALHHPTAEIPLGLGKMIPVGARRTVGWPERAR